MSSSCVPQEDVMVTPQVMPKINRVFFDRVFEWIVGNRSYDYLPMVLANDKLGRDDLEQLQVSKLRILLRVAWERSLFYRERMRRADFDPAEVRRTADIVRLPPVTKTELRSALARGHLLTQPRRKLVKGQTAGSTGSPLVVYHSHADLSFARACDFRAWEWYGWRPGDSIITVWGARTNVSWPLKVLTRLRNRAIGHLCLEADRLSDVNARMYLRVVDRVRPAILYGYVSSLVQLARIGREYGIRVNSPGAVATTAEMLFSNERRFLSDYFGTSVYDQYGSTEVNSLAFECPTHAGSHVAADHVLVETAEDGHVLVTDLDNLAMPFIRYENGDVAEWKSEMCPCGRASPLLSRVLGRRSEIIRGPNGNRVHGEFFTHILEDWGWFERYRINNFQVVQEKLNLIVMRFVALSKPRPEDQLFLTNIIREFLGDVEVEYEYPDVLPVSVAGKRQFTISKLVD